MLDFLMIATRPTKRGTVEVYPKFRLYPKSQDLMIRGGDFYAIWNEELGLWSTNEYDALQMIDYELEKYAENMKGEIDGSVKVLRMQDSESGMIDAWHKYCQKQMRDSFCMLDEKLIFTNTETNKKDFASKRLSYPLEAGDITAWDKLISTLYSKEERHKIEWAIGSIVSGDSKWLQKFMVLYGSAGTGKSTILNIIQQLFDGYYCVFDAKALGANGSQFALEAFRKNPLVGIQHDGDLSRIEDNTRLNSLVSHEEMLVNEKYAKGYNNNFKCFLFMGTNRPVKITDAKSGLIRRLIDVTPSGNKLAPKEYKTIMKQVTFELGHIANHCQEVYLSDPGYYDDYIPISMMGASNDFYNFIIDSYHIFKKDDGTTLKTAWEMYKVYCDEAKVPYPFSQRSFKEELKNYFREFNDRFNLEDGSRVRSYYSGFITDKFENKTVASEPEPKKSKTIQFEEIESIFDTVCAECPAQYATNKETPSEKWDDVTSKLSELDTSKLHFVRIPENHIVIDFDIPDENGKKCFELNAEEASKWPPTYAELSKSGQGIHLHYIYTGDVSKLSRTYDDHIEIKVFSGKSSLRRKLSRCNNLPIATISSGLPLKGDDKVINFEAVNSEKGLRTLIKRNLDKEYHPGTKPSIDFIYKILDDAYKNGLKYDVSDLYNAVLSFAANSTNQADYCVKQVSKMRFKSDEPSDNVENDEKPIVFYDVEVFPNLFLVNWKLQGEGRPVVRMINPKPGDIEELLKYRLIGFNNRDYDNHMLYAALIGYTNEQLYKLSQKLVHKDKKVQMAAKFSQAYNLSYTDVYDFAATKQSLKKWEIELGIHHQELGLPWDEPVSEELWTKVAEYCDNDVIATEAVFDHLKADFMARQIQVELVKALHGINNVTVNDTTNTLSGKLIFGANRKPQGEFNYRDLSKPVGSDQYEEYREKFGPDYKFRVWDADGLPAYRDYIPGEKLPNGWSILPFFKDYKFENGVSTYMGEEIGEGGKVYAEHGMYSDVWDGDIASQHPHSIIFECLFGPEYTKRFLQVVQARVAIKHKDFETAGTLLGGVLKPYLNEEYADDLAYALKIIINSIYGLTSAKFNNIFRDPRNIDNIVAKRGSLFMTLLKSEVQKRGYKVCHIKTDSIKIPNADQIIIDWVTKFGKEYGYTFETEANFDRFCLTNNAVYIARFKDGKKAGQWNATGAQFQIPYVFKTLFSKEPIEFEDMCVTNSVQGAIYLDMNENLPDVTVPEKVKSIRDLIATGDVKKIDKISKKDMALHEEWSNLTDEELNSCVDNGHDYRFVGKVGRFCPIKPGCGGGMLMRKQDGKYYAVGGSTGYRWLESEVVRASEMTQNIDVSYYEDMVNKAVQAISQYGDFEWFVSNEPAPKIERDEADMPPWLMACGKETCKGCPHLTHDQFDGDCKLGYDNSDYIYTVTNTNDDLPFDIN